MLIDNKKNSKVGDVLKQNIKSNSKPSIISAYFTIYAFAELKKELTRIKELRLLFTASIYQNNYINNPLFGEVEEIKFKNSLQQVPIARECAAWIKEKVKVKEVKTQGVIPFNLYHIDNTNDITAIQGSSNFSSVGLGYTNSLSCQMRKTLLDKLNIPLACKINRKLFKKQFIENFSLNVNEKKIISEDVENITLEYLLNKDKINIASFSDEENDYSEVAFIRVELLASQRLKKLANIIQYIPYPLIVVFADENKICINISPKRINKNDSSKLVVQEIYFTEWIDLDNSSKIEQKFLESLEIKNHPFTNFFEFYNSYLDKLLSFNASLYSGSLVQSEDTKELLSEIQELEVIISETVSKIKKKTDIRAKVNLNIELKKRAIDAKA